MLINLFEVQQQIQKIQIFNFRTKLKFSNLTNKIGNLRQFKLVALFDLIDRKMEELNYSMQGFNNNNYEELFPQTRVINAAFN